MLGGRRVRIGEEQRDQGYLNRLVNVANDHVHRSHQEEEHDRQRCEGYKDPSRSAPEACQLPDRQLQDRQKPQVTQPPSLEGACGFACPSLRQNRHALCL
jgi:Lon protease-like protein